MTSAVTPKGDTSRRLATQSDRPISRLGLSHEDETCRCGHAAYEDHSSADSREDDGPYGDRCHYADNCTRSAFDASISRAVWPVRLIARLSRWWWTAWEYPAPHGICGRIARLRLSLRMPDLLDGTSFIFTMVSLRPRLARASSAIRPGIL